MRWRRRNLLGLSRHDPGLAQALSEAPPAGAGLELLRSPLGAWTARRSVAGAKQGFLHSSRDPLDQARRTLSACLPAAFQGDTCVDGSVCVLLGLGLGWPALAAAELLPKGLGLWLADPTWDAFSRGLDCLDLGALWMRPRLRFFFGSPERALVDRLAGTTAWTATVADSVLEGTPGGKAWALDCLRVLNCVQAAPQAEAAGLPDWLRLVASNKTRGELP